MVILNVAEIVWKTTLVGEGQSPTQTQETISKVHDNIMADRRVMEYYNTSGYHISQDRIHAAIHNERHVQGVSTLCSKTPWTWFETNSVQHVEAQSNHF